MKIVFVWSCGPITFYFFIFLVSLFDFYAIFLVSLIDMIVAFIFSLFVSSCSGERPPTQPIPDAALAYENTLKHMHQRILTKDIWRGKFVQEKFLPALKKPLRQTGLFVWQPSQDRILWRVELPFERFMLLTQDGLRLPKQATSTAGTMPVQAASFVSLFARTFSSLFKLDESAFNHDFKISINMHKSGVQLILRPQDEWIKKAIEQIVVETSHDFINCISVLDKQGFNTLIQLTDVVSNMGELSLQEQAWLSLF